MQVVGFDSVFVRVVRMRKLLDFGVFGEIEREMAGETGGVGRWRHVAEETAVLHRGSGCVGVGDQQLDRTGIGGIASWDVSLGRGKSIVSRRDIPIAVFRWLLEGVELPRVFGWDVWVVPVIRTKHKPRTDYENIGIGDEKV